MRATTNVLLPNMLVTFSVTYVSRPLMKAPTIMTEATPMMTPSRVRRERSLCAATDSVAMRSASNRTGQPLSVWAGVESAFSVRAGTSAIADMGTSVTSVRMLYELFGENVPRYQLM